MRRLRPSGRSFIRQQLILCVIPALWLGAVDAHASSDGGAESPLSMVLIFIAGLITVSILIITALTRWGHRQDSIGNMMTFCIKYLVETRNEAQKCEAAQALGQVKDPGALLILVDLINDESAGENLWKI